MNIYNINNKKNFTLLIIIIIIFSMAIMISLFFKIYTAIFLLFLFAIQFIYIIITDFKAQVTIEEDQLQYIRKNLLYKLRYEDIREIKIINNKIRVFDILQFKDIQGHKYWVDYGFINYKDAWVDILTKVKKYNEHIDNIDDLINKAKKLI